MKQMSLYYLDYFGQNWEKCELSQMNSGYAEHFIEYRQGAMDDDIKESANSPYSLATATLDDLLMFEETSMNKREYRTSEMHQLYSFITPENIDGLMNYRKFTNKETLTLNTEAYRTAYPDNPAVDYLCSVCDTIVKIQPLKVIKKAILTAMEMLIL